MDFDYEITRANGIMILYFSLPLVIPLIPLLLLSRHMSQLHLKLDSRLSSITQNWCIRYPSIVKTRSVKTEITHISALNLTEFVMDSFKNVYLILIGK